MFMVASSVVSTILILNYHHRNADTHEMSEWVSFQMGQSTKPNQTKTKTNQTKQQLVSKSTNKTTKQLQNANPSLIIASSRSSRNMSSSSSSGTNGSNCHFQDQNKDLALDLPRRLLLPKKSHIVAMALAFLSYDLFR